MGSVLSWQEWHQVWSSAAVAYLRQGSMLTLSKCSFCHVCGFQTNINLPRTVFCKTVTGSACNSAAARVKVNISTIIKGIAQIWPAWEACQKQKSLCCPKRTSELQFVDEDKGKDQVFLVECVLDRQHKYRVMWSQKTVDLQRKCSFSRTDLIVS